jgi:hypothetical protein
MPFTGVTTMSDSSGGTVTNPYEILGVRRDASDEQIKSAYAGVPRRLIRIPAATDGVQSRAESL